MKILIIAPEQIPVPPPVGGSVENCIFQISKEISDRHQVTIVSLHRGSHPRKSLYGNVTILRVSGGNKNRYIANVLSKVKGHHYDIIQIDNRPHFVPIVRKSFPHTTISVFMHSTTFISAPMTSRKKAASDLSSANLIVGNSHSLRDKLQRAFPAQKNKVKYVHLGVDLKQFHPPRNQSQTNRCFTILFAGRLIPRKGIPVLLKATKIVRKSVPSAKLLIAGGTGKASYKNFLKKMAKSLDIPVEFKGNLSRNRMPAFYRNGDCFVCPSQGHEAFGLVNVEAMASGIPCVASLNGGIPEIVKHDHNGLLVPNYRNPEAFASQIVKLAKRPELLKRLARQARKDANQMFSWRNTASSLTGIYTAIIQ